MAIGYCSILKTYTLYMFMDKSELFIIAGNVFYLFTDPNKIIYVVFDFDGVATLH